MSYLNKTTISMVINNENYDDLTVETRQHLGDFLRELGFKGTHLGCEQGACGACNVLVDDESVRSCLMLAVQANGKKITTVEGLDSSEMEIVKDYFVKNNAMQCGFCSTGYQAIVDAVEDSLNKINVGM